MAWTVKREVRFFHRGKWHRATVALEFDLDDIAMALGRRAAGNKSRRSGILNKSVRAKLTKMEVVDQ